MKRTTHSITPKSTRNGALSAALLATLIMAAAPAFALDKTYSAPETISGGHGFDGTVTIQTGVGLTGDPGTNPHITAGVGFVINGNTAVVDVTLGDFSPAHHATLRKIDAGQTTLVGDFNYSGLTTVEAGALVLGNVGWGGNAGRLNSTSGVQVFNDAAFGIDNGSAGFDFGGRTIQLDTSSSTFAVTNANGLAAITNTIVTGSGAFHAGGNGGIIVGGGTLGTDYTRINVAMTLIQGGTLYVASDGALISTLVSVGNATAKGTLHIDGTDVLPYPYPSNPTGGGVVGGDVVLTNNDSAVILTNSGSLYGNIQSNLGINHVVSVLSGGYIEGNIILDQGDITIDGINPGATYPESKVSGNIRTNTGDVTVANGGILAGGSIRIGTGNLNVFGGEVTDVTRIRIQNGNIYGFDGASIIVDNPSAPRNTVRVSGTGQIYMDDNSTLSADSVTAGTGVIGATRGSSIDAARISGNGIIGVDETSSLGRAGGVVIARSDALAFISGTVHGSLQLRGATATQTGAQFFGSGTITENFRNNGAVYFGDYFNPDTLTATVTVGGNYTQSANASFNADIVSRKSHDLMAVAGTAIINGGELNIQSLGYKAYRGDTIDLLRAEGGLFINTPFTVEDNFAKNTMLTTHVQYTDTAVQVHVDQEKFAPLARNANERAVARALDRAASRDQLDNLFDHLNYTDKSNVPHLLARLSPEALTTIFTVGFANTQINTVNIERRLDEVRDGVQGFSARGLSLSDARGTVSYDGMPISSDRDGLTLAGFDGKSIVSKEVAPVAPVAVLSRWGFFITGSGEWADVKSTFGSQGGDFTSGGVTVGADYRVSDNFVVGLNGAYVNTDVDIDNGGDIRANGGRGGVYASYFQDGAYVNAAVNGGYNSYKIRRSTLGGNARGKTEGGQFDTFLGGGYDFGCGNFSIGPVASLQYAYVGFNGFGEHGSDANLTVRHNSQDSLRSAVGLKTSGAFGIGSMVLRPEVRAQWKHEFLDTRGAIDSSFTGAGALFTVHGTKIGRDSLVLDAGATLDVNETVSVFAYYTGELGRTNYKSNSVNGGFTLRF